MPRRTDARPALRLVPTDAEAEPPITAFEGRQWHPSPRCSHEHLIVAPRDRRVQCADCQAAVDPFDALDFLARHLDRWRWHVDRLVGEAGRLERHLEELRRLERNTKARVRTAARRVPECDCGAQRWRTARFCMECGGRIVRNRRETA
jgi:hypothetical protein